MQKRPQRIPALASAYKNIAMRSRLETKYAALFDKLGWGWTYEPELDLGRVIPDFALSFSRPILIECKPALTVAEVAEYRRSLIGNVFGWLRADVERELAALDADEEAPLALTDRTLEDLVRLEAGENPRGYTRRALVAGSTLFVHGPGARGPDLERRDGPDRVTIDGEYGFCLCTGGTDQHIGLASSLEAHCLVCGFPATAWVQSSVILGAWLDVQNAHQWMPRR